MDVTGWEGVNESGGLTSNPITRPARYYTIKQLKPGMPFIRLGCNRELSRGKEASATFLHVTSNLAGSFSLCLSLFRCASAVTTTITWHKTDGWWNESFSLWKQTSIDRAPSRLVKGRQRLKGLEAVYSTSSVLICYLHTRTHTHQIETSRNDDDYDDE